MSFSFQSNIFNLLERNCRKSTNPPPWEILLASSRTSTWNFGRRWRFLMSRAPLRTEFLDHHVAGKYWKSGPTAIFEAVRSVWAGRIILFLHSTANSFICWGFNVRLYQHPREVLGVMTPFYLMLFHWHPPPEIPDSVRTTFVASELCWLRRVFSFVSRHYLAIKITSLNIISDYTPGHTCCHGNNHSFEIRLVCCKWHAEGFTPVVPVKKLNASLCVLIQSKPKWQHVS